MEDYNTEYNKGKKIARLEILVNMLQHQKEHIADANWSNERLAEVSSFELETVEKVNKIRILVLKQLISDAFAGICNPEWIAEKTGLSLDEVEDVIKKSIKSEV